MIVSLSSTGNTAWWKFCLDLQNRQKRDIIQSQEVWIYMSLQILIWHKISHQQREEDISHKEIFKANSMLHHPVEWPEALKKLTQTPGNFCPVASCWLCYPALYLVIAQVTQNCAAWMWPLRTPRNIYSSSFKLRLHCNPVSKDSFLINLSRTPG